MGEYEAVAYIYNGYQEKFGIPRQSGLVDEVFSRIVFLPKYRDPSATRGLEAFSHLWLIWEFSKARREKWSPTVRPPRLGGNERVGVFATRSPFRPNPFGLSCVRLMKIEYGSEGPVLHVTGADLMNGTPVLDIKPYIPYTDCRPEAGGGFTDKESWKKLEVFFTEEALSALPEDLIPVIQKVLELDPRPHYQNDPERVYGMTFYGYNIRFCVKDEVLTVVSSAPVR